MITEKKKLQVTISAKSLFPLFSLLRYNILWILNCSQSTDFSTVWGWHSKAFWFHKEECGMAELKRSQILNELQVDDHLEES